jgi:hypothetical protein
MSGRAPRTAGSDHVSALIFAAAIPGDGTLCQAMGALSADAARVQMVIGTYGRPVPPLVIRFEAENAELVARGLLTGAREGPVTIPLTHISAARPSTRACIHVNGNTKVVIGGEGVPVSAGAELVNGRQRPGRISLLYFRSGNESWWQLLPTLSTRFGLAKTPIFGDWTLPFVALMLLGVWMGTVRLLLRELS